MSPGPPAVIESPVGGQATEWEAIKHEMADELGEWAKTLEGLKTILAIKGFVGTAVDRPEKVLWLLDQVKSPWIRCGYDYSHYKLLGLDMRQTIRSTGRHYGIYARERQRWDGGKVPLPAVWRLGRDRSTTKSTPRPLPRWATGARCW